MFAVSFISKKDDRPTLEHRCLSRRGIPVNCPARGQGRQCTLATCARGVGRAHLQLDLGGHFGRKVLARNGARSQAPLGNGSLHPLSQLIDALGQNFSCQPPASTLQPSWETAHIANRAKKTTRTKSGEEERREISGVAAGETKSLEGLRFLDPLLLRLHLQRPSEARHATTPEAVQGC